MYIAARSAHEPEPPHVVDLSNELARALLREIVHEWRHIDWSHFHRLLALPSFEITDSTSYLGRWCPSTRTIQLSRALVLGHPWTVVREVLKHEMAHQYVTESYGECPDGPHGAVFRDVCARFGIDAASAGVPRVSDDPEEERLLHRVARLLALAESPNVHEAEAAMGAAQRLMLKYNIEAVRSAKTRDYGHRHLGVPTGRVSEAQRLLGTILSQYFFVETLWVSSYRPLEGKRGTVLEICGTPANLDTAEYVHGYLQETADRLWREHQVARGITKNRDRLSFLSGVMTGFLQKLARQASTCRSQGLVWQRDADLAAFFRGRHPRTSYIRADGGQRTAAFQHGRSAGEQIILHRGVKAGAVARGRLLGGG